MSPEQIDALTLGEVKAIAREAEEAVEKLQRMRALLGGGGTAPAVVAAPKTGPVAAPVPGQPFPCAQCGRERPIAPGEPSSGVECPVCGNPLPLPAGEQPPVSLGVMTSKGFRAWTPDELAMRAAKRAEIEAARPPD